MLNKFVHHYNITIISIDKEEFRVKIQLWYTESFNENTAHDIKTIFTGNFKESVGYM